MINVLPFIFMSRWGSMFSSIVILKKGEALDCSYLMFTFPTYEISSIGYGNFFRDDVPVPFYCILGKSVSCQQPDTNHKEKCFCFHVLLYFRLFSFIDERGHITVAYFLYFLMN